MFYLGSAPPSVWCSGPTPREGRRVADVYTEPVTVQLSPEMRDRRLERSSGPRTTKLKILSCSRQPCALGKLLILLGSTASV